MRGVKTLKQYMKMNGTYYLLQQRPIQKGDIVTWEYKEECFVGKVEKCRKRDAIVTLHNRSVKVQVERLTVLKPVSVDELRKKERDWILQLVDLALDTNDQEWFTQLHSRLKNLGND
jgi:hypothetical protein